MLLYWVGENTSHSRAGSRRTFLYMTQWTLPKHSDSPCLVFLNPYHGLCASLAPTHSICMSLRSITPFLSFKSSWKKV